MKIGLQAIYKNFHCLDLNDPLLRLRTCSYLCTVDAADGDCAGKDFGSARATSLPLEIIVSSPAIALFAC
jgi:hypothetical protein